MSVESRAWIGRVLMLAITLAAVVGVDAQNGQRKDPSPAYRFEVEIGGATTHFRSVSGLKIETEVIEYREGGENAGPIRKIAGVTRVANIRLSRRFTGDRSLYDWFVATQKPRVDGRIIMYDHQGTRVAAWKFSNGFPVKWEGPDLDASGNEVSIETIEIAHEGLTFSDEEN